MESKEAKMITRVPVADLPEGAKVGSRFEMEGVIDGMEGDMAVIRIESLEMSEEAEVEPTEEDARIAARQMDEQMGYME